MEAARESNYPKRPSLPLWYRSALAGLEDRTLLVYSNALIWFFFSKVFDYNVAVLTLSERFGSGIAVHNVKHVVSLSHVVSEPGCHWLLSNRCKAALKVYAKVCSKPFCVE